MTLLTMARYEWFEEWSGSRVKNRGPEYEAFKMEMAHQLLDMALVKFPQLRDKVTPGLEPFSPSEFAWLGLQVGLFSFSICNMGL